MFNCIAVWKSHTSRRNERGSLRSLRWLQEGAFASSSVSLPLPRDSGAGPAPHWRLVQCNGRRDVVPLVYHCWKTTTPPRRRRQQRRPSRRRRSRRRKRSRSRRPRPTATVAHRKCLLQNLLHYNLFTLSLGRRWGWIPLPELVDRAFIGSNDSCLDSREKVRSRYDLE